MQNKDYAKNQPIPYNHEDVNYKFYSKLWNNSMYEYLSNSSGSRWFQYMLSLLLKEVNPITDISTVVDIGCGIGIKTAQLARHFNHASVIGTDFSLPAISSAIKYNKSLNNLSFLQKNILDEDSKNSNAAYDIITCFDVLEHLEDWKGFLNKIANKSSKYILLSFPTGRMRNYEKYVGHYRNFKKSEVENYLESIGFETIKTYYAGFPFMSPIVRDATNLFYRKNEKLPITSNTLLTKLFHRICYILFRYCSAKNYGDFFFGLFKNNLHRG